MYVVADDPLINCQAKQPGLMARAGAAVDTVARTLQLWRTRVRERHTFSLVDERDLRDLGLARYDVQRELAKPFWKG
jgi:uncharacterized protein YjiS (DUF1127 family)